MAASRLLRRVHEVDLKDRVVVGPGVDHIAMSTEVVVPVALASAELGGGTVGPLSDRATC